MNLQEQQAGCAGSSPEPVNCRLGEPPSCTDRFLFSDFSFLGLGFRALSLSDFVSVSFSLSLSLLGL